MTFILERAEGLWKVFNLVVSKLPIQKLSDEPLIKPPNTELTWGITGEGIDYRDENGTYLGSGIEVPVDENGKTFAVIYAKPITADKPASHQALPQVKHERIEAANKIKLSRQHSKEAHVKLTRRPRSR